MQIEDLVDYNGVRVSLHRQEALSNIDRYIFRTQNFYLDLDSTHLLSSFISIIVV